MQRFEDTALEEKDQEPSLSSTKYEMSLAEFPLFLLSKHKIQGLEAIVYSDKIIAENKPVERSWRVTWSNKYGPATQSAAETFFALFQIWAEVGFESPWIHFGTIRAILLRRGIRSACKKDYQRILRDLHCLSNLYIEAKNAFYDSTKKKYVDASFHLFEGLVLEKDTEGNPDPTTRGYIKVSPVLLAAARKNCFALGIDEKQFFALPGIQQRLYLYLQKMFTFQKFHVRNLSDIARQIPLYSTSEKKIKQQIKKASQALLDADVIPSFAKFRFYSSPTGGEKIRFERSDSQQISLFEQDNKQDGIDANFGLIKDLCTDEHSFPFYRKIAAMMNTDDICRALSESKQFARDASRNGSPCSIPKVFTSRIISIAKARGISLLN
jgi:hypothetical protein